MPVINILSNFASSRNNFIGFCFSHTHSACLFSLLPFLLIHPIFTIIITYFSTFTPPSALSFPFCPLFSSFHLFPSFRMFVHTCQHNYSFHASLFLHFLPLILYILHCPPFPFFTPFPHFSTFSLISPVNKLNFSPARTLLCFSLPLALSPPPLTSPLTPRKTNLPVTRI